MSTITDPLKYLFEATYKDGFVFRQPANDKSPLHSTEQVEGGGEFHPSAFRAVQDYEKEHGKLIEFWLKDHATGREFGVNLDNAAFCVGGEIIQPYFDERFNPYEHKLQVVFFREIRKEIDSVGGEVSEVRHYVNRYILGWQAVGEGLRHVIAINN